MANFCILAYVWRVSNTKCNFCQVISDTFKLREEGSLEGAGNWVGQLPRAKGTSQVHHQSS